MNLLLNGSVCNLPNKPYITFIFAYANRNLYKALASMCVTHPALFVQQTQALSVTFSKQLETLA